MWSLRRAPLLVVLCLLAASCTSGSDDSGHESETTEAAAAETTSTGEATEIFFTADPDGFAFRNYSGRYPEGNLTIDQTREMFGDGVCSRIDDETCVPHPKVQTWIDGMNETMNTVGHCTGFTVTSNRLHAGLSGSANLGGDSAFTLDREVPVLQTIAQGYAAYYASNVWSREVSDKTPTEILEAIQESDEPVDLGLFQPQYGLNGHSVLGHTVIDAGDGKFHIAVYDSNRPGEDNIVVIDTKSDTWFYADAAINPDEPSTDYFGDAQTKSLSFIPASAYDEQLECPAEFSELCSEDSGGLTVVAIAGKGSALIRSDEGQIGMTQRGLVNTIEGAQFLSVRGDLSSSQQPLMLVPAAVEFELEIEADPDGGPLKVSVFSEDLTIVLDRLVAEPEQVFSLGFDPLTSSASFESPGGQAPIVNIIYEDDDTANDVQLIGIDFAEGEGLDVSLGDDGTVDLEIDAQDEADAVVFVTQTTDTDETVFASTDFEPGDGTQTLDLSGLQDDDATVTISLDIDGDGVPEETTDLVDVGVAVAVGALGEPESVIDSLDTLAPYLDPKQARDVASALPAAGFGPADLGEAFRELPTILPDDLPGLIEDLGLTPEEVADLTFGLRLDDDAVTDLAEDLGFDEEMTRALEDGRDANEEVADVLEDWDFKNTDDASDLPGFLEDAGLDPSQTEEFLDDVDLPEDEIAEALDSPQPND